MQRGGLPTTSLGRRVTARSVDVLFLGYVAGLLLWLSVGLLPPLVALVGGLRDLAVSVAGSDVALSAAARALLAEQPSGADKAVWAVQYLFSALNLALGLLLAVKRPGQLESRLLSWAFIGTAATFNEPSHVVFHFLGSAPVLSAVHFAFHVGSGTAYLWAVVLFPDGRLPVLVRRSTALIGGALATATVTWICWRSSFIAHPPFFVAFFGVLVPVAGIAAQSVRVRAAAGAAQAQQARLLRSALVPALITAGLWLLVNGLRLVGADMSAAARTASAQIEMLFPAVFAVIPVMLFVAILRYRLWELDLVISRALLVSLVAGVVSVLYVVVLAAAAVLTGGFGWSAVVAVIIVAVVVEPVRQACTRLANRVVFGQELPPREALRELTGRLARTDTSDQLADLTRVIVAGTRAGRAYVWVLTGPELTLAASAPARPAVSRIPVATTTGDGTPRNGEAAVHAARVTLGGAVLPVRHEGAVIGVLAVSTPPGVGLPQAERRLVEQLAGHAGMLLANAALSTSLMEQVQAVQARRRELATSRHAVVLAQDTERRRLERDMHDGAQQELVAFLVHLGILATMARTGRPVDCDAVAPARELLDASRRTVADLASGGAPAVVRELGVCRALQRAVTAAGAGGTQVTLRCSLPENLDISVGVVVYFTCLEALQNATKHARAATIDVFATVSGDELHFGVADDGIGIAAAATAGSGLDNVISRVVDAGGSAELTSRAGSGTALQCRVPYARTALTSPAREVLR
ncbi:MAG TPA: ATP-binding protein [Dermatophilaceae bacterium]|nr:ATP-binding protein [Dermatophilaceae bacterium]